MIIGTSHFVNLGAALQYYEYEKATISDIHRKIKDGEIHLGPPTLKPGERLILIDDGLRYAIEE